MSTDFRLYVPIEKIDKDKRTVAGWATTEEIDKQNEIVDFTGSKEAFTNWQGNIREMHEPKAVGKSIEIKPNDETKKIWIEAYISKGAPDTWEKIKEGILNGFSIGGQTLHKTQQIVKDLANGSSRTITRIMKYKLNELSLVDNPANPGCSFSLVKSIDGIPYQTEIVEDIRKVIMTEAEDPLRSEVHEHRSKADSLVKKIFTQDELEKLGDDDFGVIRKFDNKGVSTKERLLPMPDKVHAVRALEVAKNYGFTAEEVKMVHKKAQEILGAAYDNYKNLNRGGEDDMSKEQIDKLISDVKDLTDITRKIDEFLKAQEFEGAYRPIAGAKEHPNTKKANDSDPSLGESAPLDGRSTGDPEADPKTQDPKGAYPAKGPIKSEEAEDVFKSSISVVLSEINKGSANSEDVDYIFDTVSDLDKMSDEEYNKFVKDLNDEQKLELDFISDVIDKANAHAEQQFEKDGKDSEGSRYPGKHVATLDLKTQDPEGAYPAKGPVKAYDNEDEEEYENDNKDRNGKEENDEEKRYGSSKKSDDSEKGLSKLEGEVKSLRKRLDETVELLKRPMPRKTKIEKNLSDDSADELELQIRKQSEQIAEWRKSGKELSPTQQKVVDDTLNKMIDRKFS